MQNGYEDKLQDCMLERKEIRTGSIDDMSRDDVLRQLKELGLTGEFKKEGANTVLSVEEKSDSKGPKGHHASTIRESRSKKKSYARKDGNKFLEEFKDMFKRW